MATTFMTSPRYFFTSESVSAGHPDKICDQISDGILDALLEQDPMARVACEVAISNNLVVIIGEITANATIDYEQIVRDTIREIGYTRPEYGFDLSNSEVLVRINKQSPDIKQGVDRQGAGDQGMMIGFACDETPELMPLTIALSHRLVRRLALARKSCELAWLRPDAKSQVTVQYACGQPVSIDTIVMSTQHDPGITQDDIRNQLIDCIIRDVVPTDLINGTNYIINPTGKFVTGGPQGDAVDWPQDHCRYLRWGRASRGRRLFRQRSYKGRSQRCLHGALCRQDVVAAGLAKRFELQVSYAIGETRPTSLAVETFGTGLVDDETIEALIDKHFDMSPAAIIRDLDLRRPIYRQVAAYGHFGRDDVDVPWEQTDMADVLRAESGLA